MSPLHGARMNCEHTTVNPIAVCVLLLMITSQCQPTAANDITSRLQRTGYDSSYSASGYNEHWYKQDRHRSETSQKQKNQRRTPDRHQASNRRPRTRSIPNGPADYYDYQDQFRCMHRPLRDPRFGEYPTSCRGLDVGKRCRGTCWSGYTGSPFTVCREGSTGIADWGPDRGKLCARIVCKTQPRNPAGGTFPSTCTGLGMNQVCKGTCSSGFRGRINVTCKAGAPGSTSGRWGPVQGKCARITACLVGPDNPRNGVFPSTCAGTLVGGNCTAVCNAGSVSSQIIPPITRCLRTGDWSVTIGRCLVGNFSCPAAPSNTSAPNSNGFTNCNTTLGSTCRATCTPPATGPGYTANCTFAGGVATWVVTGNCTAAPLTCPASPPANSSPNSGGFSNCQTAVGSVCRATCTPPATGPGYNATCTLVGGVPTWEVAGSCTAAPLTCPASPPANSSPNSGGFSNCQTAVGSVCRATCTPPATGPGYNATCTLVGEVPTWEVAGSCTAAPLTCPASPPANSSPNSGGFSNCQTAVGSVCRATCTPPATGPGYTANCTLVNGVPTWVVAGSCTAAALTCPASPPTNSTPNSGGFSNCQTAVGSVCTATCTPPATGPGYNATCTASGGVAIWEVSGLCSPGQSNTVNSCASNCGRRELIDRASNTPCYCDYWCNLYNDCCGGMNAAAATAKDAACPEMSPTANIPDVLTCSAQRGVLAGVDACASYRPAGCWCDKFCVAAADCCDSCPATCGATCPAAAAAQIAPRSASNISSLTGECGTARLKRLVAGYKEQQGVIAPRAFSAPLEARVQACQDALTQTDVSTPVVNIPVYVVNVRLGTVNAPYTSRPRANSLAAIVNTAYARAGYRFTIASVTNITFPDQDALDGTNCFNGGAATCERCNAYRQVVPASAQGSRALVWYMRFFPPVDPTQPVTLGAAFRAQDLFNPVDSNNLEEFSCIDGLWALALSDAQAGSAEQAVLEDSYTVIHEVGHWLGLDHTWNENVDTNVSPVALCNQQLDSNYNNWENIRASWTDGVRDTAPQLPAFNPRSAMFFSCTPDGTFRPTDRYPALSCDGRSLTNNRYLNNFYNYMSYYQRGCTALARRKTFSAGQIARMKCVYACYRENQCGLGTFPYNPPVLV